MKKKLAAFLTAILLLSPVLSAAQPAGSGQFLQSYQIQDGHLQILCTDLPEGEIQLTLDGQSLPVEVSTVAKAQLPVTVYCLVDVSGSMNDAQMDQVRQALQAVSSSMRAGDNMVIGALGNSTISSGILTTEEERGEAIEGLAQGTEDTNLYAGIVESIQALQTDPAFHRKQCLVILSDGEDCQDTGYTQQEAVSAIQTSDIPVYTIATLRQNPSQAQKEDAKVLGSFARYSTGGLHSAPVVDGTTAEEAGQAIWSSMSGGTVLDADLNGLEIDRSKNEVLLRVTYGQVEDTLTLYTQDLPQPVPEDPGPEPDDPGPDDPEPEPEPGSEQSWLPIVLIAAAAVIAVGIGAFFLVRKKKRAAQPPLPEPEPEPEPAAEPEEAAAPPPAAEARRPAAPAGCTVILTPLGHGDVPRLVPLPDQKPVVLGRDSTRADVVLDSRDSRLSGAHCQLMRDGKKLYASDLGSTNGSFINGVPIQGKRWMPLSEGDTLRAGSNEYRVRLQFDS